MLPLLCSEAASCRKRLLPPAAPGSPCSCTQKYQSANIGKVETNKKSPDHLTSLEKLLQPPTTDPVLVAHGDRGEGERVLVVDRGGDVHRPGEELLGQAHLSDFLVSFERISSWQLHQVLDSEHS